VKSSYPAGSLAELPCGLYVNVVQQDVQQQGRTTARMHDRGKHGLAAEIGESSHAGSSHREGQATLALFGRRTTLNAVT
jgi:hypothetical protein